MSFGLCIFNVRWKAAVRVELLFLDIDFDAFLTKPSLSAKILTCHAYGIYVWSQSGIHISNHRIINLIKSCKEKKVKTFPSYLRKREQLTIVRVHSPVCMFKIYSYIPILHTYRFW